ncbi:MAG: ATP-binding cassette domain-containing protein [Ardenticatenaceae bacterium]|nr:ATP-binding cassette domain-containing protein [Ardenticatenaceae bacterium]MCB9445430.1 ATP-binding cassette domain-containing protein [Ardenticatenaceae bacterium]
MSNREIEIDNLVKVYSGSVRAVDGVSLHVEAGQIYGFLGPNGAGKSTAVKILTTLGLPTSGTARVGGYDVVTQAAEVRRIAGVALQDVGIDPLMKPGELLALQARLFGANRQDANGRAQELMQLVQLTDAANRRVGTYSGGMKRRLDLAMALVHKPEILFLDEPTTGLDPASRRDIWQEVRRLNQEMGMTIFLTTQYLEEADELADMIGIIDRGQIVKTGSPAQLKASLGKESLNLAFAEKSLAEKASELLASSVDRAQVDRDMVRLYLDRVAQAIPGIMDQLRQADLDPISLTLTQPTLDDVFLQVTGQALQTDAVGTAV